MRAAIKITFFDDNDEKFFGEGPYRLLLAVEETGSLRSASKSMGLAYSKAFRMIKNAEGSTITPEGKEWLKKYEQYREACIQAGSKLYMEIFSD